MGLYERLLQLRASGAPPSPHATEPRPAPSPPEDPLVTAIVAKLADLESIRAERKAIMQEAATRFAVLETMVRHLDGQKPARGARQGWKGAPDPDRAALDWFDFVVATAGLPAVRPLLDQYHAQGWLNRAQHAWFMDLARSVVPPDTAAQLPADAALLERIHAKTQELLGRTTPASPGPASH